MDKIKLKPKKFVNRAINNIEKNMIVLKCGHIIITNYKMGDNWQFEKSLSVWNDLYYRYDMKAGYYIEEYNELRIMRGYPIDELCRYFPKHQVYVDRKYTKPAEFNIELLTEPRNDFQLVAITHMLSKGKYENLAKYTQQIIDADTGDGKTYCGVAATSFMSSNVVVIVPRNKLVQQWIDSFVKFTTMTEDDIIYINGSKMCEKLREGKYSDKHVFIFIADTIRSYRDRYGNIATMQMLDMTNAYTKIVDEIHMKFGTINMIEALCNFRMNYYMSASFGRTGDENKIFVKMFKNVPRFGSSFKHKSELHINIIIKKYQFTPSATEKSKMYNMKKGLNIKLYEQTLIDADINKRQSFNESVCTMIKWSLEKISESNKILILCSTKAGINYIKNILLSDGLSDDQIGIYHSGISKADKEVALTRKIIISTDGSLGTGADILGIEHIHNIITYSNFIYAKQLPGRGRAIDGRKIIYIEYVNTGYISTTKQFEKRKPYLQKNTPSGKLIMID